MFVPCGLVSKVWLAFVVFELLSDCKVALSLVIKNPPANAGDIKDPWVRKSPWMKAQQPTPVFLPGEPYGQRSLAGYSPWGHKELDTTT